MPSKKPAEADCKLFYFLILKMESVCYSETSVSLRITCYYNPEDRTIHSNSETYSANKCLVITRDRILTQMHISFLQPKSTLYVWITSFLKFQTWFDGVYKCIFCLFYE
jgi:hypothetical protein